MTRFTALYTDREIRLNASARIWLLLERGNTTHVGRSAWIKAAKSGQIRIAIVEIVKRGNKTADADYSLAQIPRAKLRSYL